MSTAVKLPPPRGVGESPRLPGPANRRDPVGRSQSIAGYLLSAPYLLLMLAFGIGPAIYVVYLSFVGQQGGFVGIENYRRVANDFRYGDSFLHVLQYSVAFLVPSLVIGVTLALLLESRRPRTAGIFQVIYFLPQGLVGPAGVIVWLFMLTPGVSPIGPVLSFFGFENLIQVVSSFNIAAILAVIAVWTSGNTILMFYAALTSIPAETLEAARLDGANPWQIATRIKLPMLRKWLAYLLILNIGAGTQLFAEPQLLANTTGGAVADNWSPLQLAYTYAYQYADFGAAAALSLQILLIGVAAAALIVWRFDMFKTGI